MTDLDAVRTRMRTAAGDVTALHDLLLEIRASVPPSAQETSQEDLDADPDVPTELRAVLDHVLSCLEPLGTDLLSAAAYEPASCVRDALPGCDLTTGNEPARRAIHELAAAVNFQSPKDGWPPYTPEQAGLEVVFLWGRYFATWWKLEEPDDLPEGERREVLCYKPDSDSEEPGAVTCLCL